MDPRSNEDGEARKIIYYDGSCPMCSSVIKRIDGSSRGIRFDAKDITKDSLPSVLEAGEVEKEIHVIGSDGEIYRGSEAVLRIVDEYPTWRFLARIGNLPIVSHALRLGYKFVAANRHFIFGPASRIFWLKAVVGLGLISGLLLSVSLWVGPRYFPMVPLVPNVPAVPIFLEFSLFLVLIAVLTTLLFWPKPKMLILAALMISVMFAFFDQMRWQPWFFQYFFMLIVLGLFSWNYKDEQGARVALNVSRLILASIYFWSGLQKLNSVFVNSVFPWMVEPVTNFMPEYFRATVSSSGLLVPFLEMGIGIGLLSSRFRKWALALVLTMLVFVLFTLGPWGHNWNSVVWPWNVAMALFAIILFWRTEGLRFGDMIAINRSWIQKAILVLFMFMPLYSFFGLWDSYFSFALYSGNTNSAQIYINSSVIEKLPNEAQSHIKRFASGLNEVDFFGWAFSELNAPPYPEARVYKSIGREMCEYANHDDDVLVIINHRPSVFVAGSTSEYNCSNL